MLTITTFFAFSIMGLGFLSLLTDTDIIAVPGLGQGPGAVGIAAAVAAFAAVLIPVLRARRGSFATALFAAVATAVAHLVGVWLTTVVQGDGMVPATAAVGDLLARGPSGVIAGAALLAAVGGIMLRRARSTPPRWPWEKRAEG